MEFFAEGTHVRLRTTSGKYLHALEDGQGARVRGHRESLNAAWAVQHAVRGGRTYVLLRSAANGLYLALRTTNAAPETNRRRVCQAVVQPYDRRDLGDIRWKIQLLDNATRQIQMEHCVYGIWYSPGDADESKNWAVEAIPPRLFAPELPQAIPPVLRRVGGRTYAARMEFKRQIRYIKAVDMDGRRVQRWRKFQFEGKSVSLLRDTLAVRIGEQNSDEIVLCVRAGKFGLPTPLVIDLPANELPMDIIVYILGSPGTEALRYPDFDAPAP